MTNLPARRRMDDRAHVRMIICETLTTLGIDASSPAAIIEVQKTWAFATKARKIISLVFTTSLVGGLGWLGGKLASLRLWA